MCPVPVPDLLPAPAPAPPPALVFSYPPSLLPPHPYPPTVQPHDHFPILPLRRLGCDPRPPAGPLRLVPLLRPEALRELPDALEPVQVLERVPEEEVRPAGLAHPQEIAGPPQAEVL